MNVLIVGFSGGRGKLYAECVAERAGLNFSGVVKSRREPDLTGFIPKPKVYESLGSALEDRNWDVVIVSVPHGAHDGITRKLIEHGVKVIIKEKPLAITTEQSREYAELMAGKDIALMTTTQRMVQPSILKGLELMSEVGRVKRFDYRYHFALPQMTSGWRANKDDAIGGVLLDMGYHALDVLNLYFGPMTEGRGTASYLYKEMAERKLEDRVEVELSFGDARGTLSVDRHAPVEEELFRIEGEKGTLEIRRAEVVLYDVEGREMKRWEAPALSKQELVHLMLDRYLNPEFKAWRDASFQRNRETVWAIETIYKSVKEV